MLCTLLLADNLPVSRQDAACPGFKMSICKRMLWRKIPNGDVLCIIYHYSLLKQVHHFGNFSACFEHRALISDKFTERLARFMETTRLIDDILDRRFQYQRFSCGGKRGHPTTRTFAPKASCSARTRFCLAITVGASQRTRRPESRKARTRWTHSCDVFRVPAPPSTKERRLPN